MYRVLAIQFAWDSDPKMYREKNGYHPKTEEEQRAFVLGKLIISGGFEKVET